MNTDQTNMNRRNFLSIAGIFAAGAVIAPKFLLAQVKNGPVQQITNAAAVARINITKLRGNISMLEGSGGNIAVLNGPEGKLLVDAGINVSKAHVQAALQKISDKQLKYLINSHWHFDHTSGNEWLHNAGATIIAQDVTRDHLTHTIYQPDWDFTFKPMPKAGMPAVIYKNEHNMQFNGEKIHVKIYKPAHTDGDSSIYFQNADILHAADTFWNTCYPFIDYATGGNIDGMITAAAENVKRTNKHTIIIPGHGEIGNHAQVIEYYEMLLAVRDQVSKLKKQGRTLQETIAAKPTAKFDPKFGNFVIKGDTFTNLVYRGV